MLEKISDTIKNNPYPLIFMGDFNARPNSEIYAKIAELLKDTAKDKELPFTIPSTGATSKIDYIFTSADIVSENMKIVDLPYSDHYPVMTTMEW